MPRRILSSHGLKWLFKRRRKRRGEKAATFCLSIYPSAWLCIHTAMMQRRQMPNRYMHACIHTHAANLHLLLPISPLPQLCLILISLALPKLLRTSCCCSRHFRDWLPFISCQTCRKFWRRNREKSGRERRKPKKNGKMLRQRNFPSCSS